jgi:putative hydrolase of the HAD superfamily
MIKNIIFDIGGVLLEWNPAKFELPADFKEVFESLLWGMHDGGLVSRKELMEKLPSHIDRDIFHEFLKKISKELRPIPEMIDLFHTLKKQGYQLYILSNMPQEMHVELVELHDFFDHPVGQVFSYQVKAIKPQPQIYEALLAKFNLKPEESVFIDDRLDNVVAAERLKIKAIQCRSSQQVIEDLKKMGISVE